MLYIVCKIKKMTFRHLLIALLCCVWANAQQHITSRYLDIEVNNNVVYTLTTSNKLVVWDVVKDTVTTIKNEVVCIGKQHQNLGAYITKSGDIVTENPKGNWNTVGSLQATAFSLHFDANNKPIVVSSDGVYYNKRYHLPTETNRFGNNTHSLETKKMLKPSLT